MRSAAAKFGWIIVGRGIVVGGPKTTRHAVVALDPCVARHGVVLDNGLAWTNDDMSRFGMMYRCGGVRRGTESDKNAQCQDDTHGISPIDQPCCYVVRGRSAITVFG